MITIDEKYLKLSRGIRQSHLDLSEKCTLRGGMSGHFKGVLAQFLDSDIPGQPAVLCHACKNSACSNPRHLYWGTYFENNVLDGPHSGTVNKGVWQRTVEKYGEQQARQMNARPGDRNPMRRNK